MAGYKKYLNENPWGVKQNSVITWTTAVRNDSVITQKTVWEKLDVGKWVTEVLSFFHLLLSNIKKMSE